MRGCFGGCTFCSITEHEGRIIQNRSKESILTELTKMGQDPEFKGVVSDLGGPTANWYQMRFTNPEVEAFVQREGLKDQVLLTGRVGHDDVPGLLAAMDLAILPSAGDYTSPVKLFEFMACGIAPIAPNFLPIQEVVKEGQTGWLFPAGELDVAVQSVLERSQDVDALRRVGAAARQYIAAERQWYHNVVQLVDFWQRLRGQAVGGRSK